MGSTTRVAGAGRDIFRSPGAGARPIAARQADTCSKSRAAQRLGFYAVQDDLSEATDKDTRLRLVDRWSGDPAIHGILMQLSLLPAIHVRRAHRSVAPPKKADVVASLLGLVGLEPMTIALPMVKTCER
jgi:5,10-methylene-tetrahydrofolate dehydrogenase/methenyl tetrahydrofolate cyclohydrolase